MILVTGGAGFIGSNLVAGLAQAGLGPVAVNDVFGHDAKWKNLAKHPLHEVVDPADLPETAADISAVGFVNQIAMINLTLAVFNMLPAFPMDGGRVLRALLSLSMGRVRGTEAAAGIGRALAVGLGFVFMHEAKSAGFTGKQMRLVLIDGGSEIASLTVMGAVIAGLS